MRADSSRDFVGTWSLLASGGGGFRYSTLVTAAELEAKMLRRGNNKLLLVNYGIITSVPLLALPAMGKVSTTSIHRNAASASFDRHMRLTCYRPGDSDRR